MSKEKKNTISSAELSLFCGQVALILEAGLPLYDGMETLAGADKDSRNAEVYKDASRKVTETGSLYEGKTLRTGSPRCDGLVKVRGDAASKDEARRHIRDLYGTSSDTADVRFLMYAPTYREGNSEVTRTLSTGGQFPDLLRLRKNMEKRFGGSWYILLRLHPQLVARRIRAAGIARNAAGDDFPEGGIDASGFDDMYELLAGCDAFLTDYSSAAFDAAVAGMPVFLFCDATLSRTKTV